MTLYRTTSEQQVRLYEIAAQMSKAGLTAPFIAAAVELACVSEGLYELFVLWEQLDGDPVERAQVIADLQEAIDESEESAPRVVQRAKVSYDELDEIGKKVLAFKAKLRRKVDKWGGITKLAEVTGMPQPSLSRFFSSASMPRRTTLYKIARAMDLPDKEIVFDWVA